MAEFHDTLNPVIWEKYKEGYVLKPEVKRKLKQIANAFIESLEINKEAVEDIVITGSMASYNYTPHSDIDLHLLIDFEKVHKDCPIVGDYLLSKKSEFNQKHDIFIYGIPVEVYAEAVGNDNVHNGLYSLENGWIDLPQKLKPTTNDAAVKAKYEEYKEAADGIKDGDLAEKLLDKIKKMRKSGLAEGGEFSVENLVFKKLRDTGVIEKLMKVKKEGVDKKLSLGEALEVVSVILEAWNNNSGRNSVYVDDDEDDKYHAKKYGVQYHDREMTPDQYIKRATSINNKAQGLSYKPKTVEKQKRVSLNNNSIEELRDRITDPNKKIDRPYLDYSTGDQEGIHRAIAAKDAGIKKIPVRVFHATTKGGNYIKKGQKVSEALSIMEQILDEMEGLGGAGSINTGTSVFAPYPVDVVGRDNPFKVKKEGKRREKKAILGYKYKKNWGKSISEKKGNDMDIFENLENLSVSEECFKDILNIAEEYINEVSIGLLGRAANSSKVSRANKGDVAAARGDEKTADFYDAKADHAEDLSKALNKYGDSEKSANKLFKAARNSMNKRDQENLWSQGEPREKKRFEEVNALQKEDPVKSRTKDTPYPYEKRSLPAKEDNPVNRGKANSKANSKTQAKADRYNLERALNNSTEDVGKEYDNTISKRQADIEKLKRMMKG